MKNIAVIGCGMRAESYLRHLHGSPLDWKLVAVADPVARHREIFRERHGSAAAEFESGPELLDSVGSSLDGVIIAPPNMHHLESALRRSALASRSFWKSLLQSAATSAGRSGRAFAQRERHP